MVSLRLYLGETEHRICAYTPDLKLVFKACNNVEDLCPCITTQQSQLLFKTCMTDIIYTPKLEL